MPTRAVLLKSGASQEPVIWISKVAKPLKSSARDLALCPVASLLSGTG